jgi:hypothetical protein
VVVIWWKRPRFIGARLSMGILINEGLFEDFLRILCIEIILVLTINSKCVICAS